MNRTKKLVVTGLLIAIGIVLPMAFHTIADAGKIFLPMHIPVLLCGLICGPIWGLLCGLITPVLSSLMTGMPPIPVLPGMVFELVTYGFISGLLFRVVRTKNNLVNIYISLIVAMLVGRGVAGFVNGLIFMPDKYSITMWATASFVKGLPGIVIQLIFIPTLVYALFRANLFDIEKGDIWSLGFPTTSYKNKKYFNQEAPTWDSKNDVTDEQLNYLIDKCNIKNGDCVLDVGCGTGIIDKYIVERGAKEVTAIDLSDKMIDIAKSKNTYHNVNYSCQNFYELLTVGFDKVIIFNAYPHFTDKKRFVKRLNRCLKGGGSFVILHSGSPESINGYHKKIRQIAKDLRPASDESHIFERYFEINEIIDDGTTYMIYGTKK